jgi:hypothetical protein
LTVESQPTVGDMMTAYAQDAIDHAKSSSDITLDYSPDSARRVEEVLERLHAAIPRGLLGRLFGRGPSAQDIWKVSKMYGGYLGEVFRRTAGGEWDIDKEIVPGENTICLRKGKNRIWPPAKVYKRLTNGSEDNVWFYSQLILKDW